MHYILVEYVKLADFASSFWCSVFFRSLLFWFSSERTSAVLLFSLSIRLSLLWMVICLTFYPGCSCAQLMDGKLFIHIFWTSCFPVWTNLAIFVYCGFLIRVICTRRIFRSGDYTLHTVKVSSWWQTAYLEYKHATQNYPIISCLRECQIVHVSGYNKYTHWCIAKVLVCRGDLSLSEQILHWCSGQAELQTHSVAYNRQ